MIIPFDCIRQSSRPYIIDRHHLDSHGRVLAGSGDADIGAGEELGGGKGSAKTNGKDNNDHCGVGRGITQPVRLDGGRLDGKRGVHAASSKTARVGGGTRKRHEKQNNTNQNTIPDEKNQRIFSPSRLYSTVLPRGGGAGKGEHGEEYWFG